MQNFSTYPLFYTHFHTKKLFIYFSLPLLSLCFSCVGYGLWEVRMWVWFDLVHKDCGFFVFLRSRSLLGLWFRSVFAKKKSFFFFFIKFMILNSKSHQCERKKKKKKKKITEPKERESERSKVAANLWPWDPVCCFNYENVIENWVMVVENI